MIQPEPVPQLVSSTIVPGQVAPRRRDLDRVRPEPELPASRSSIAPNTLGESTRGRHIHSTAPLGATSATVSQSDRNA